MSPRRAKFIDGLPRSGQYARAIQLTREACPSLSRRRVRIIAAAYYYRVRMEGRPNRNVVEGVRVTPNTRRHWPFPYQSGSNELSMFEGTLDRIALFAKTIRPATYERWENDLRRLIPKHKRGWGEEGPKDYDAYLDALHPIT